MIFELLFKIVLGFFDLILSLIPTFNFNFGFDFSDVLSPFLKYANLIIDVKVVLLSYAATIVVDQFGFIKKIIFMIIEKIPFIN